MNNKQKTLEIESENGAEKTTRSLWRNQRGAEVIEKLVMIAMFVFVAAVGLKYLGDKTSAKLESQGTAIEGAEDTLPQ